MQGREAFAAGLRELGFEPEVSEADAVSLSFRWLIENGPRKGQELKLTLRIPGNFPIEAPHGPYYRPAILRDSGKKGVHPGRHFGPEWDHWSRPHPKWAATKRTVEDYLRHLRTLNEELPPPSNGGKEDPDVT